VVLGGVILISRGGNRAAPASLDNCVRSKFLEVHEFERGLMRGLEDHRRGATCIERLLPSGDTEAPFVARLETLKAKLGHRRAEVIAGCFRELEKLLSHQRADGMQPAILCTRATVAIAKESGERIAAAALEVCSKDVGGHEQK
jgi:hypothetical protein